MLAQARVLVVLFIYYGLRAKSLVFHLTTEPTSADKEYKNIWILRLASGFIPVG